MLKITKTTTPKLNIDIFIPMKCHKSPSIECGTFAGKYPLRFCPAKKNK
jgi:hypothetical protein